MNFFKFYVTVNGVEKLYSVWPYGERLPWQVIPQEDGTFLLIGHTGLRGLIHDYRFEDCQSSSSVASA